MGWSYPQISQSSSVGSPGLPSWVQCGQDGSRFCLREEGVTIDYRNNG